MRLVDRTCGVFFCRHVRFWIFFQNTFFVICLFSDFFLLLPCFCFSVFDFSTFFCSALTVWSKFLKSFSRSPIFTDAGSRIFLRSGNTFLCRAFDNLNVSRLWNDLKSRIPSTNRFWLLLWIDSKPNKCLISKWIKPCGT